MPGKIARGMAKVMNPLTLKIAGRRLRAYSVVRHIGRRSGREYANPVAAYPLGDGFVIALAYGRDSNWVRNVLNAGKFTLTTAGADHVLERPEIVPAATGLPAFPRTLALMLRLNRTKEFLWAHEPMS
ncbi:nitroreductase [Saccharomonospora sp. NPDC046836]|uniref:nitroreductase n=1 Tax=Saccharomonospora sp. NPDC046836 TaxID=3156921 RepID=UPI0033E6C21B